MHSVKIEFCPLDWYSSSPTTIVLYNKMYMWKVFPSNRKKLKKRKCDLHEISSVSPKAAVPKLCAAVPWGAVRLCQGRRESMRKLLYLLLFSQ